jgi:hypothetical protein
MTRRLFLNATWWLWIMLAVSLLMTAEYTRLILITDTATYRIFVLLAWVGITLFWLARIIMKSSQEENHEKTMRAKDENLFEEL